MTDRTLPEDEINCCERGAGEPETAEHRGQSQSPDRRDAAALLVQRQIDSVALSEKDCNHRSCEAVTARMQKEAAGNPDPCPWCEIERLREELKYAKERSFVAARISYRGFSYGTSSQWGIDSLRRAIMEDGRG